MRYGFVNIETRGFMKKIIWTLILGAALGAGLANAQGVKFYSRLPVAYPGADGYYSGTILSVGADSITLWDGNARYVFLVNAGTSCGRDNALGIPDLEAGQQVIISYAFFGRNTPTAIHIDPVR